MKLYGGLDIGSRSTKCVIINADDCSIVHSTVEDSGSRPTVVANNFLESMLSLQVSKIVATGYGRHIVEVARDDVTAVTEIKACARGVFHTNPNCKAVLDIGGQDLKAIAIDERGRVSRFEMNDRCAAGTGQFLESMARRLGFPLNQFGDAALIGKPGLTISAMCAVFAEGEVVGLLNSGKQSADIALAVHVSVAKRLSSMYKRLGVDCTEVALAGGGALNPAMVQLISKEIGVTVTVPPNPQSIIALGAALVARDLDKQI